MRKDTKKTPMQLAEELKQAEKAKEDLKARVNESLLPYVHKTYDFELSTYISSFNEVKATLLVKDGEENVSWDIGKERAHTIVQFLIALFGDELKEPMGKNCRWEVDSNAVEEVEEGDSVVPPVRRSRRSPFTKEEISWVP